MRQTTTRRLLVGLTTAVLLSGPVSAANADAGWGGGSYGSGDGRASSYINPDTGAATANNDVDPNSNCFRPDQYDMQMFSPAGTATKNVHNDACFLDRNGKKLDGPATFESRGVGFISACPDPDNAGPKTASLLDKNADGRADLCFQSGYQTKGVAGDFEFHARLNNNTGMAGTQYVTWCSDKDADGCSDEWNKSSIRIDWSADGKGSFSSGEYDRRW